MDDDQADPAKKLAGKEMKEKRVKRSFLDTLSFQRQLHLILKELREEAERLKITYPIFDVFAAKKLEVERMQKALETVSHDHPDRNAIEALVKAHLIELEKLAQVVSAAERKLQLHLDKIHLTYLNSIGELPSLADESSSERGVKPREFIRIPED